MDASESYQAEDAFSANTAAFEPDTADASGTGYVDALGGAKSKLIFAVNVADDGMTAIKLRYRSAGETKAAAVHVNCAEVGTAALAPAASFAEHEQLLPLRAGLNSIAFVNDDGSAATVSIDRLELSNGAPRPERGAIVPFVEYEAENGTGTGVAVGPPCWWPMPAGPTRSSIDAIF